MRYISAIPTPDTALPWPRRLALMGSTGSIGRNALRVVAAWPDKFHITALAGGRNIALLAKQATLWRPPYLALLDDPAANTPVTDQMRALLPAGYSPQIFVGPDGFAALAALPEVDMVLSAQMGAAGLRATLAAALAGKHIALANKESLVMAGDILRDLCAQTGAVILPVDSEHSALFQCLGGRAPDDVARLVLTASGGPFLGKTRAFLEKVGPKEALAHPNWSMGAKISIDSATLMNKGLEVIEACRLYDMPEESVGVVVHRESLIHSLVEFRDASLLAQLAVPDMRLPLISSLAWPTMLDDAGTGVGRLDLAKARSLHFEAPDGALFPCLDLARRALRENLCVELNAANEVAVERFLAEDVGFLDIPALVKHVLDTQKNAASHDLPAAASQAGERKSPGPCTLRDKASPEGGDTRSYARYDGSAPCGADASLGACRQASGDPTDLKAIVSGLEARDALTRNLARAWRAS